MKIPVALLLMCLIGCEQEALTEAKLPPATEIKPIEEVKKPPKPKGLVEAPTSAPATQEVKAKIETLQKSCEQGNAPDCVSLGKQQWFLKNFTAATTSYQKACDANDDAGCRALAVQLLAGLGAKLDLPRANTLLSASCEHKDAEACLQLSDVIAQGRSSKFDATQVQFYLERACDYKSADACYLLGLRSDRGRESKSDPQGAKLFFEKACELQSGFACRKAANYYSEGRLAKQDVDKANELLAQSVVNHGNACQAGSPGDCIALGGLYLEGMGTQISKERATSAYQTGARYYEAMCDAGSLDSCVELTWLLSRSGPWVLRDKKRSKALELSLVERLPVACEAKDLEACYQLAVFYATGNGVDEDRDKASELFQKVCDAGLARGCSGVKRIERKEKQLREAAHEDF